MIPPARPLVMLTAVVLLASTSSWVTLCCVRWNEQRHAHKDAHEHIHEELQLTADQEMQLVPLERRYEEDKRHCAEKIRIANLDLAVALREDKSESPRVLAAIQRIQKAQGELQMVTLRHVFEMKAVLPPSQYDQLIRFTAEALVHRSPGH